MKGVSRRGTGGFRRADVGDDAPCARARALRPRWELCTGLRRRVGTRPPPRRAAGQVFRSGRRSPGRDPTHARARPDGRRAGGGRADQARPHDGTAQHVRHHPRQLGDPERQVSDWRAFKRGSQSVRSARAALEHGPEPPRHSVTFSPVTRDGSAGPRAHRRCAERTPRSREDASRRRVSGRAGANRSHAWVETLTTGAASTAGAAGAAPTGRAEAGDEVDGPANGRLRRSRAPRLSGGRGADPMPIGLCDRRGTPRAPSVARRRQPRGSGRAAYQSPVVESQAERLLVVEEQASWLVTRRPRG
jgi:hypothetical protein